MNSFPIYDSIFDAFRSFAPYSPLIQLESPTARFFRRTNRYDLVEMENGQLAAFPGMPFFPGQLYRGEPKQYGSCKPSIYRSLEEDSIIIDELKFIEFKNILLQFPQIQQEIEGDANVDSLALAQHYELNTNLLDLTSEPEIAAYFATHQWVNGVAEPVTSGIGCIRVFCMSDLDKDSRLHKIGLQCFQRPGIQAAYGYEMNRDDDLNGMGMRVFFKQTQNASISIHMNFHMDQGKLAKIKASGKTGFYKRCEVESETSWIFPQEEIADVAKLVKTSKVISKISVEEYGKSCDDVLARNGIAIQDDLIYLLSPQHYEELDKEYQERPYGDAMVFARLSC